MIQLLSIKERQTAERIYTIQQSAYRVEADLMGVPTLPPLQETIDKLQQSNEIFLGYFEGDALAGVLSFKKEDQLLDIHRMMVDPQFFRRGIASKLLQYLLDGHKVERTIVSTGAANEPARQLYERFGFTLLEEKEIIPGVHIASYEKRVR